MADWAGKTLGKVHINDLIARGGMAEVYMGTHDSFGRVAVKVMRGLLEQDSDQLARFQREAEVIEDLRHQNIVQMLEYAVENESPYLVMEYIPGPSLATYLKKLQDNQQRLPIGIVAHILQAMASALDYAHRLWTGPPAGLHHAYDSGFRKRHPGLYESRTGARRKSRQADGYLRTRHHAL